MIINKLRLFKRSIPNKLKLLKNSYLNKTYKEFKKQAAIHGFSVQEKDLFLIADENTKNTAFDTHYIYHPAWAARIVKKINPEKHIDISSTLHFCTQLSAFVPTEFYDFRPAFLNLDNFKSGEADLCNLTFASNSVQSLSCMHTVEHIGLGRYSDPIDFNGDKKAVKELQRVLAYNGNLLFVTPVGKPTIRFNAHRVYAYEQIISMFDQLELVEFSLVPDNAETEGMITNADPGWVKDQEYACGCFWFTKVKQTEQLR